MSFEKNTKTVNVTAKQWGKLSKAAEIAFSKAYAPYSNFKVGAAALTADNKIIEGCNVENASYGLTICAERNCIAHGIIANQSNKKVKFTALVIYTAQEKLTPPCGACRQVISEFFPKNAFVMAVNHLNEQKKWTVEQLLPDAFTPDNLLNKR
ncbi:MAG: cytidine deaminase [Colwellia sp.]|nr:cytidine deaminase [Colwellia sp.]